MNRNVKKGLFLLTILFFCAKQTLVISAAASYQFAFPEYLWELKAYNTYISFQDTVYLNNWGWDSYPDNEYIFFYDVIMDGIELDEWWIKSPDGNVTIQDFFVPATDTLKFSWSGSGSASVTFFCGGWNKPEYIKIDDVIWYEGEHWTYNTTENSVTVTDTLSTKTVLVSWEEEEEEEPPYVPPIIPFLAINETWYFRSDSHTILDTLAYKLMTIQSSDVIADQVVLSGTHNISYGVRVWVMDSDGDSVELTPGAVVGIATRTVDGESLKWAAWDCPGYSDVVDALLVKVYQRFGNDDWNLRRTFITKDELLVRFPVAEWKFEYYMNRTIGSTYSYFKFGSLTTLSAVTLIYERISPWDQMFYRLGRGEFVAFLVTPWTYLIDDLFWGLILMFLTVTIYNRYRSLNAVLAVFWIFGGAGGILSLMLPAVSLELSWLFLAFALAVTLFKLFI